MEKVVILWILALLITIATAVYQRLTVLTYPITGSIKLTNQEISNRIFVNNFRRCTLLGANLLLVLVSTPTIYLALN